jgi:MFS family permease
MVTLIMIGSVCTMTSIETVFSRNLPKEVRGTMNSIQTLFGTIGGLAFTVVGGHMFDLYGTRSPFLVVAGINLIFATFVTVSGIAGWFKH